MATINGVNVDRLVSTIEAIKEDPSLAEFRFRAETQWIEGGHTRTKIQGFYGPGAEDTSAGFGRRIHNRYGYKQEEGRHLRVLPGCGRGVSMGKAGDAYALKTSRQRVHSPHNPRKT